MAEGETTGRRPRRAASKNVNFHNGSKQPSAMHYVGYVEEDETPEQIMAKFEQLEKIQREAEEAKKAAAEAKRAAAEENGDVVDEEADANAENEDFDEELLVKVFRQTSQFSLKRALKDDIYGDEAFEDEPWSDDEIDEENIFGAFSKKKRKRGAGGPKKERVPRAPKPQKSHMITAYNSDNQMLMRKKKVLDPRAPNILKLPPHPIPQSWGRVVEPYRPPAEMDAEKAALPDCVQETLPILSADLTALGDDFLAVHCNPPWDIPDSPDRGGVTVEDIAKIPFQKLAPYGFVFMWVEKENLSQVCDVMLEKAFVYVENMTWVQMHPNNTIANCAAQYLCRSHRTMLMFRRDVRQFPKAKDVELRHQRSADVTLDVLQTTATGRRSVPPHVYKAMETLLPEAYKAGYKGKLLELWSEPGVAGRRSGWTVVADAKK